MRKTVADGLALKDLYGFRRFLSSERHDDTRISYRGESAFHACLLCEAAEFSRDVNIFPRHVNICFVRPPEFHIKEQIMFL